MEITKCYCERESFNEDGNPVYPWGGGRSIYHYYKGLKSSDSSNPEPGKIKISVNLEDTEIL